MWDKTILVCRLAYRHARTPLTAKRIFWFHRIRLPAHDGPARATHRHGPWEKPCNERSLPPAVDILWRRGYRQSWPIAEARWVLLSDQLEGKGARFKGRTRAPVGIEFSQGIGDGRL